MTRDNKVAPQSMTAREAVEVLRSMKGWRMPPGEGDAINAAYDQAKE